MLWTETNTDKIMIPFSNMENPQVANALKESLWKALENFTAEFDVDESTIIGVLCLMQYELMRSMTLDGE